MMLTERAEPPVDVLEPGCRLCGDRLHLSVIDLGCLPLANRTVTADAPHEALYPLHVRICETCLLVQVADLAPAHVIAITAPYLSSRSATCVIKARQFAETMCKRMRLNRESLVIEIGSNDGTLLRHFRAAGVAVLGIEPALSAASVAIETGIPTEIALFNTATAMEIAVRHGSADLLVANDVLPHAPDLFDFAAGFACILRPNGVAILQVPHLLSLMQRVQFDAFRHDTYSYLSLQVLERVLRSVGLRLFDAERIPDHGGSLRVHACHAEAPHAARPGLKSVRLVETFAGLDQAGVHAGFSRRVAAACEDIKEFLRVRRSAGRTVAAYGAATRGGTLLNVCGIATGLIGCVADPDPAKHGRRMPGSRIPIVPVERLMEDPPNDVLILPWTNAAEAVAPLEPLRQAGTQLWTPLPRITRV